MLNTTWGYYPYFSYVSFFFMVLLTLVIEITMFYLAFRGEKRIAEYLLVLLGLNLLSGVIGLLGLVGLG